MLYAKVVLGLAIPRPFDYKVLPPIDKRIKEGSRVWVTLRNKKTLGYVVKLVRKTNIKNLKNVLEVIDDCPLLNKDMLLVTKRMSDYYCCSWGEAICAALPEALRRGRRVTNIEAAKYTGPKGNPETILVHDLDGKARWDIYFKAIKETLDNNRSVIVLFPDFHSALRAQEAIATSLGIRPPILYRKQPQELKEWLKIKEGRLNFVLATRSGIFAPFNNLGLVIIDEEQDPVYKQGQVPHYNPREVALIRVNLEKARLILGSGSPSLESLYLARKNKIDAKRSRSIKYVFIPRKKDFPEVKIIDLKHLPFQDRKKNFIFSKILEDAIYAALNSKGKALLFLNRKGFATFASCNTCGLPLKCPRCNINLAYHFRENILNCHYCNFKMTAPSICPTCNAGYIKYTGLGTEKIESELSRLFAQARIKRLDSQDGFDMKDIDIVVATSSIIKQTDYNFDLIGILNIDNSLNRIDFRSSEKAFDLLLGLMRLTDKKMILQTSLPNHHCFKALLNKDINMFYDEELGQRRQLYFPPYKHIALVKLRGKKEEKVKEISYALFKELNKCNKNKGIKIVSVNPAQPSKLRGNFYWQVLISSGNVRGITELINLNLKDFPHSGIIVTVDVDPI